MPERFEDASEPAPLDGSGVAGLLSELFAIDMSVATLLCNGCAMRADVAEVRVYGGAMGAIFRCIRCDTAMMRIVRTPRGFVFDCRGARSINAAQPS